MTTPMMQQYRDAKERHPGMLLLFRMGDFFEMFEEDAEVAARVLGLTLTSRDKQIPMAGFPHHQLEGYLHKLLHLGFRVAVCDQVEEANQAKGLVKREVTRVVTPGTVTEDDLLDPRGSNHLVALLPGTPVGLAWVDVSAGQFGACDVPAERLGDELARLAPVELIYPERHADAVCHELTHLRTAPTMTPRPDWTFDAETGRAALHRHFGVTTLAGFGFDDRQPCLRAAGALLLYAQEMLKTDVGHLRRLRHHRAEAVLHLDEVTRRSLELTRTLREGQRDGSLLAALDRTVTSMGARLLHAWLLAPLTDRAAIEARLDAVAELAGQATLRGELRATLEPVQDLQRLTARVSTARATPRDLGAIAATLRLLPPIKAKVTARRSALLQSLEAQIELCPDLRGLLDTALVENPPQSAREGDVIRPGYDAALDQLRKDARGGKDWLASYQAEQITRTGIPSLKVGYTEGHGYYIEVTNTHRARVPDDYRLHRALKNSQRYVTAELLDQAERVLNAQGQIAQREYELFVALREQVAARTPALLQAGEVLAHLDVLAALAEVAVTRQYVRPELCDEPRLEIRDGRHPVLDQTLPPGTFVPNDVDLGATEGTFWLITGPNMAGKSVFIRQAALLALLAHVGSFVPARSARVGLIDRIFTRVGAGDELNRGQSTFMVEMTEAANILNNATPKSLVILDEIGRGTSTYDGVSIAWALTEYLHTQVGCRTLFATHYHELAQLAQTLPQLRNYNVLVREWRDDIVFVHKIAPGAADKSYGIHVARLAGIPAEVIDRARQVLNQLETHHLDEEVPRPVKRRRRIDPMSAPTLFQEEPPPATEE